MKIPYSIAFLISVVIFALVVQPLVAFEGRMDYWTGHQWQAMNQEQRLWFVRGFMLATYAATYGIGQAPPSAQQATLQYMAGITTQNDHEIIQRVNAYYRNGNMRRPIWQTIFAGGRR